MLITIRDTWIYIRYGGGPSPLGIASSHGGGSLTFLVTVLEFQFHSYNSHNYSHLAIDHSIPYFAGVSRMLWRIVVPLRRTITKLWTKTGRPKPLKFIVHNILIQHVNYYSHSFIQKYPSVQPINYTCDTTILVTTQVQRSTKETQTTTDQLVLARLFVWKKKKNVLHLL